MEITKEEFVAWLKTKNPEEEFNSDDSFCCCFAQFLNHRFPTLARRVRLTTFLLDGKEHALPEWFTSVVEPKYNTFVAFGAVLAKMT